MSKRKTRPLQFRIPVRVMLALSLVIAHRAKSETITWTGAAGGTSWHAAGN